MEVEVLEPGWHWSSEVGGFRLTDWSDVDELIRFRAERRTAAPDSRLLFTLDDRAQAAYTSGHTAANYAMDPGDLTDAERTEYQEAIRLSPQLYSRVQTAGIRKAADSTTLDVDARLLPIDAPEIELLDVYDDPGKCFRTPLECLEVLADEPSMAIVALPNGYFSGDLQPEENYLLAERLRTEFGFEFFGLGSYLASYVHDEPLSQSTARAVVDSVKGMYINMSDELAQAWAEKATGKRWFVLSYRGS